MSYLSIAGLRKRYGPVTALDSLDMEIPFGSRTAVVGPSGSGKTTLLRLIAGFELPDAGRIVLGNDVLADGGSGIPAHRRGIGFVAQDGALFPHLTVADNIGFGLDRNLAERGKRIATLMESVELNPAMADRRPHQLSGGQQQRVALARAMARQPRLMLLDEPFSALDTGLRDNMRRMVGRVLGAAGITSILVTHDQPEALSFADQIVVLDHGRLMQAGHPRELYQKPRDELTATVLGEAIVLPATLGDGFADSALGRIPVETGNRRGPATIMLRPEQLVLTLAIAGADPAACYGHLTELEFGGATSTGTMTLEQAAPPLRIRVSGVNLLRAGDRVRVSITGRAHIVD